MKRKLLIFHPIIAPYRIDFFNRLSEAFETKVCLMWRNLHDQTFDYRKIEEQFDFAPTYMEESTCMIPRCVFSNLRAFNPDVVLVSEVGLTSILVILYRFLFRKKYRIISIIDDSYDMLINNRHFTRRHELAERLLIPLFDDVINVEPRVADFFQEKYGKGICFPIIVDEHKARKRYEDILPISENFVRKYGLEGKKVVLFVGRLVEIKNPQGIVNAFKKITDPDLRLVLVGSGNYQDTLADLAKDDGRIIITGRFEGDELYAWYNIASVFCLPSFVEPFGAVTNEALLGGCWSLISEKAGSQCLIEEGINGNLIYPYNQDDFVDKLSEAIERQRETHLPLELKDNFMRISFDDAFKNLMTKMKTCKSNGIY